MACVEAIDDAHGNDRVEIFGAPIGFARGLDPRVHGARVSIPAHRAARIEQHFDERREMGGGAGAIDEQSLGRAANARSPQLGVENDLFGFAEIGVAIDEHMHDAFEMREHRHSCLGLDAGDEALAAARHDHVEIAVEAAEHFADRRAVLDGHEGDRRRWQTRCVEARDETVMDSSAPKKSFPNRSAGSPHCRP